MRVNSAYLAAYALSFRYVSCASFLLTIYVISHPSYIFSGFVLSHAGTICLLMFILTWVCPLVAISFSYLADGDGNSKIVIILETRANTELAESMPQQAPD